MSINPYRYDSELDGDVVLTIPSPSQRLRRLQARALRLLGGSAVLAVSLWLGWGIIRALDESPEALEHPAGHEAPAAGSPAPTGAGTAASPAGGGLQLRLSEQLAPR